MSAVHPSRLALDRLALGEVEEKGLRRHLESCAQCRAHTERLDAPPSIPGWVRELESGLSAGPSSRSFLRWAFPGGLVVALAGLLLVLLLDRAPRAGELPYTTVKGLASVAVHIKRGDRVQLWDRESVLLPGDALRLEVAPEEYRFVGVFTESLAHDDGPLIKLFAAPLETGDSIVLPKAWQVDRAPGPEVLIVVLSTSPVTEALGQAGYKDLKSRETLWVERLILPKDTSQ